MKKLISILLAISLLFSLTSCFVSEEQNEIVDTQVEQTDNENTQVEHENAQNEEKDEEIEQDQKEDLKITPDILQNEKYEEDEDSLVLKSDVYTQLYFGEKEVTHLNEILLDDYCAAIDSNGKLVIPFGKYEKIEETREGLTLVCFERTADTVYTDIYGNEFTEVLYFEQLYNGLRPVTKLYTYVDLAGKEVLGYFSFATSFCEGTALVYDAKLRPMLIDKDGSVLSVCEEDGLRLSDEIFFDGFQNDLLRFLKKSEGVEYCLYTDKNFNIVTNWDVYYDLSNHHDGLKNCYDHDSGYIYYENEKGEVVLYTQGIVNVETAMRPLDYSAFLNDCDASDFSEGLACLHLQEEPYYRYIDTDGKTVIEGIYGGMFSHGLAAIYDDETGKCGYMNKEKEFLYLGKFKSTFTFNKKGLAMVFSHEEVPEEYYSEDPYACGYYCGYINTDGEVVIPLEYYCASDRVSHNYFTENLIWMYKLNTYYYYDMEGNLLGTAPYIPSEIVD